MQLKDQELSFVDEIPYFVSIVGGMLCLYLAIHEVAPNHKLAHVCSMMFIYSNLFAFLRGKTWVFHLGHLLFWSLILFSFADFFPFLKGAEQVFWTVLFFVGVYTGSRVFLNVFKGKGRAS